MKKDDALLEKFEAELVKLCHKYNAKIIASDEGISIEFILADDGYSKEYENQVFSIGPDGIISDNDSQPDKNFLKIARFPKFTYGVPSKDDLPTPGDW